MKKVLSGLLFFAFLLSLVLPVAAQLADKKAELNKVIKYVNMLDKKIIAARKARQINRLAKLKQLKRDALDRAKGLKAEIAKLEAAPAAVEEIREGKAVKEKPRPKPGLPIKRAGGLLVGGGYGAGSAIVDVNYALPLHDNLDLAFGAGLGIGSGYSIILGGGSARVLFGNNFAGLDLTLANYSEALENIPGISGTVAKGMGFGVGLSGGTNIGPIQARLGYNTALGLIALGSYKL